MTVAELIAELSELPQDAPVATEGCDCVGPCDGAGVETGWYAALGKPYVLLERNDEVELFPKERREPKCTCEIPDRTLAGCPVPDHEYGLP